MHGTEFAAGQGFTAAQTFGAVQRLVTGTTFGAAQTFGDNADFSAGTHTFSAAQDSRQVRRLAQIKLSALVKHTTLASMA